MQLKRQRFTGRTQDGFFFIPMTNNVHCSYLVSKSISHTSTLPFRNLPPVTPVPEPPSCNLPQAVVALSRVSLPATRNPPRRNHYLSNALLLFHT